MLLGVTLNILILLPPLHLVYALLENHTQSLMHYQPSAQSMLIKPQDESFQVTPLYPLSELLPCPSLSLQPLKPGPTTFSYL